MTSGDSGSNGNDIIYFDHAATSWPKAPGVAEAVALALTEPVGNPGRSGHRAAVTAARLVTETREDLADLLGVSDSSRVVFTRNATEALNTVILGLLQPGDHAVTTGMEHNSVMRPLRHLEANGIELTVAPCAPDGTIEPVAIRNAIKPETRLVVTTHASNVTGTLLPITDIATICRAAGVPYLVDAAQTAGVVPIDVESQGIDLLACSGHKGLLGPSGTGALYIHEESALRPITFGGTGSRSDEELQPNFLPDAFESGTLNVAGLAGLGASIRHLRSIGVDSIREHLGAVLQAFILGAEAVPNMTIHGPGETALQVGTVSFSIDGVSPSTIGQVLDSEYGIMCRVGLHCAPIAHRTIGTFPEGTVRFGWGPDTSVSEIEYSLQALSRIARHAGELTASR